MLAFTLYRKTINTVENHFEADLYEKVSDFYAELMERTETPVEDPAHNIVELFRLKIKFSPFYAGEFKQGAKLIGSFGHFMIRSVYKPYRSDHAICLVKRVSVLNQI